MLRLILLAMVSFGFVGCAGTPTVQSGPDAELSYDGLTRIDNSAADLAWVRPDADFKSYSKIMLAGAGVEYRPVKDVGRSSVRRSSQSEFPVSDDQKEKLRQTIADAFLKELKQSEHFTLTTEPGGDTLLVVGKLVDVVSSVPPERAGRVDVFLNTVGEATLVLEIRDSMSNAVLARAVDRRAAESASGATWSNPVSNWAEVRRLANTWARLLRRRLDEVRGY